MTHRMAAIVGKDDKMSWLSTPNPAVSPGIQPAASTLPIGGSGQQAGTQSSQPPVDYMKLILAQMTNLNPMDPSSSSDGTAMMMQAESLNLLNQLSSEIQQMQVLLQTSNSTSLLGRSVSGVDTTGYGREWHRDRRTAQSHGCSPAATGRRNGTGIRHHPGCE